MPVHNGAQYLRESVESILGQTFRDFELLVINDGSTDDTADIVASFGDPRIRLLHNETNLGLIATLNRGLDESRGDFIARMDHDDVSLPQRLERLLQFFTAHPSVGICGSSYIPFGQADLSSFRGRCPTDPARIHAALLFNSPLGHPTVMMRRAALERHGLRYRQDFVHAEDYDLWARAADCFPIANVPDRLLRYRVHPGQVTYQHGERQRESAGRVRREQLRKLGVEADERQLRLNDFLCGAPLGALERTSEPTLARECAEWLMDLDAANRRIRRYARVALDLVLLERWAALCWLKLVPRRLTLWKTTESARLLRAMAT
jgi:glycosyltransferase involved in cell wall biosynthesis